MRRIVLLVLVALLVAPLADAQQGKRRATKGGGRKLRDTAAPQSGSPVGATQNSLVGQSALRPPTKPNYRPPVKPLSAPREREVGGQPMTPRTRGGANPYAGRDMRGEYARRAPVGGRRLRSQSSDTLKAQLNRNLTRFTQNQSLNRRFSNRRGS